jgi:hypothetical protein
MSGDLRKWRRELCDTELKTGGVFDCNRWAFPVGSAIGMQWGCGVASSSRG